MATLSIAIFVTMIAIIETMAAPSIGIIMTTIAIIATAIMGGGKLFRPTAAPSIAIAITIIATANVGGD